VCQIARPGPGSLDQHAPGILVAGLSDAAA
jgi:hypothetical protein